VDGDAVAGFELREITEHSSNFVHAFVELLIRDDYGWLVFRFRDENQRGFVPVFGKMAVDAVVAGVELAADEPFPERRVGSVEGLAPGLVPIEETGVVVKAFREMLFAEFLDEGGILEVRLRDELLRRPKVLFLLPVDGNLGFRELVLRF
jgi:hypothetical protein